MNNNTMFIGTGDRDGGSLWSLGGGNSNDNNGIGILEPTDGGQSWNTTGLSLPQIKKLLLMKF